ncbi:hypothetical protein TruAng_010160 [Truncatella angustata]|nr:hypothetical protein TruAng_010160 [Truncatella angustata]
MHSHLDAISETVHYLQERKSALEADGSVTRQTFTIARPHHCQHCGHNVLSGPLDSYMLPQVRGARQAPMHHEEHVLQHGMRGAIEAAQDGCAFYQWILDELLVQYATGSNGNERLEDLCEATFRLVSRYCYGRANQLSIQVGVSTTRVVDVRPGIFACAEDDDPAAFDIRTRPMDLNVASSHSVALAQDCLRRCIKEHPECRDPVYNDTDSEMRHLHLPTRLLNISLDDENVLKVHLSEMPGLTEKERQGVAKAGFATLSYCWGGPQEHRLVEESRTALLAGQNVSVFPKTIQDAIKFTHLVGLRYLWVDALCILQDNENDKAIEISRMSSYYGANAVTILAASSAAATEGFLKHREDSGLHDVGPFRLPYQTSSGATGSVLLYHEVNPGSEPTTSRGWTLQETMLSHRLLIFSSRQLFWRCHRTGVGCGGSLHDFDYRAVNNTDVFNATSPMQSSSWDEWKNIVEGYSRRSLSVSSDKLPAISAVARQFVLTSSKHFRRPITYYAGLLHDTEQPDVFRKQLLWATTDPSTSGRCWPGYGTWHVRAPSWSWACMDGNLLHVPLGKMFFHNPSDVISNILDISVQLCHKSLPYGMVRGGSLEVKGSIITLIGTNRCSRNLRSFIKFEEVQAWSPNERTLSIALDTQADRADFSDVHEAQSTQCIQLLVTHTCRRRALGLVIKQLHSAEQNVKTEFMRIGVFAMKVRYVSDEDQTDGERRANEEFFDHEDIQTTCIL